ncbi:hypothetical protein B0H10DRAFT_2214157 [Mycena sp. CBHHK59/15]|nr:hypothetical protein B0H10DRAFT_2214157 [Mycena sp. CBHHK59/15]
MYAVEEGKTHLPETAQAPTSLKQPPTTRDPLALAIAYTRCPHSCGTAGPILALLAHACPGALQMTRTGAVH